jgi:hypothetical protein
MDKKKIQFLLNKHGKSVSIFANNRKNRDSPVVTGFREKLAAEVDRSSEANEDKFNSNVDALAYSGLKTPSVVMESYILSATIAKMERNTDFLPKNTDKALAGNCGRRVMPPKLRKKIFGLDFDGDDYDCRESTVDIIDYKGSLSYQGVMCCHNIWACPMCARKLSERRKKGLSDLLNAHFMRFGADTVTASLFTIPHSQYDNPKDINKRLTKSYKDMRESRDYKQLMKTLGGCGSSRALEVTWATVNGFHPHIHVLHYFENCLMLHIDFIADTFFNLWADALKKNGFDEPSRKAFGCKLVGSDSKTVDAVSAYFSKPESDVNDADILGYLKKHPEVKSVKNAEGVDVSGWSVAHEMTKWHLKQARSDSKNYRYSMFDFVRGYAIADANGDEESKKQFRTLWLLYREAFKGQRQLWTTHKHFKISELELSDDELGEKELEEPVQTVVASIDFKHWLVVVFMGARGVLLEKAKKKGAEGVASALEVIVASYREFFPDNPCQLPSDDDDIDDREIEMMSEIQLMMVATCIYLVYD